MIYVQISIHFLQQYSPPAHSWKIYCYSFKENSSFALLTILGHADKILFMGRYLDSLNCFKPWERKGGAGAVIDPALAQLSASWG
jgi:hypothetical protein